MRIAFIGCVTFSEALLQQILQLPVAQVVAIVTRSSSAFNADFRSLQSAAEAHAIPCFLDSQNRQDEMAAWLAARAPEVIYCFGWPYLLGKPVLSLARLGCIGYHPTALPRNRGRHPIIWTLVLGLRETASSFFFMDEGADSGDLLSQEHVTVEESDDAASLYARLQATALRQVRELTPQLAAGSFVRTPQDPASASYWRKRGRSDGRIDWRMPAQGIYNLIRALARPYPGAHLDWAGTETKVWRCEVLSPNTPTQLANLEPGRVLAADTAGVDVRCGEGVVRLTQHEFTTLPPVGVCL